jgi:hypothetical protein
MMRTIKTYIKKGRPFILRLSGPILDNPVKNGLALRQSLSGSLRVRSHHVKIASMASGPMIPVGRKAIV